MRGIKRIALFPLLLATLGSAPLLAQSLPLPPPQYPIAGSGSGGAYGPFEVDSSGPAGSSLPPAPEPSYVPSPGYPSALPAEAPVEVLSRDASFSDDAFARREVLGSTAATVNASLLAPSTWDIAGAACRYNCILNWGDAVYNFSGSKLAPWVPSDSSWCPGGGFPGDPRVMYDPESHRWIATALCVHAPSVPATNVIAVSKTTNPQLSAGWYVYNYPACGYFDDWDGSDQPHAGFNSRWIVVDSACSANSQGVNGAGLAVFDKFNLYNGGSLVLNDNWWQFVDPWAGGPYSGIGGGDGTRNDPARTYTFPVNNREYLTTSLIDPSGRAQVIYSHVEGPANSPVYYPTTQVVTTSFDAIISNPNCFEQKALCVDAPGCTGCIRSLVWGWTHSTAVWRFTSGDIKIMSTFVMGDPRYSFSTQIIGVATDTCTGAATALQFAGGISGSGPLASELAMVPGTDNAFLVYDHSRFDFYPGVKAALWDVVANSVGYVTTLQEGILTPDDPAVRNRWVDYIDAAVPVVGSIPGKVVVAGTVARPSSNDPERATYWAVVTP